MAAVLPPALIPELSTGFWHGDVSTDPPSTSARVVGEGTQTRHNPVTHPMEMPQTTSGTRVRSSWRSHRRSPTPSARSLLPPSSSGQHSPGVLEGRAVRAARHPPRFKWTFLPQPSTGCLCPPVPSRVVSGNFTSSEKRKAKEYLAK